MTTIQLYSCRKMLHVICINKNWKDNCGLPQEEAPDLLAEINDENGDTYFIKQPKTLAEISRAIAAAEVRCTNAVRYSGKDKSIIKRMYPGTTDYKITILGKIVSCDTPWWHLW